MLTLYLIGWIQDSTPSAIEEVRQEIRMESIRNQMSQFLNTYPNDWVFNGTSKVVFTNVSDWFTKHNEALHEQAARGD